MSDKPSELERFIIYLYIECNNRFSDISYEDLFKKYYEFKETEAAE